MKLSQIVMPEMFMPPEWDKDFNHLVVDSRDVQPGDVFIARQGSAAHGNDHIADAVKRGAVAVLAEGDAMNFRCEWDEKGTTIPVFTAPEVSGCLTVWLHRRYDITDMKLIAVTGTNGKSSVTQYIAQLATAVGQRCGVIGTLGNGCWPELQSTRNTTPDLSVVLRQLHEMREQGVNLAALEVSSHGLSQQRVAGMTFDVAILTNLTQDHLDYHGTMEDYFAAKRALFTDFGISEAFICDGDEYGQRLLNDKAITADIYSYGKRADSRIRYDIRSYSRQGIIADLASPWGEATLTLPLIGEFNLANVTAAVSALTALGFDFSALVAAAAQLSPVNGRMELYVQAGQPMAVIDFAHTPDALRNVLQALQPWQQQLVCVFGCGGDRDRSKRPLMAQTAQQLADMVWLTDDNPRTEDPQQIFSDALAGAPDINTEHDREAAIRSAISAAKSDAIVLIAGKGHENYQDVMGIKTEYSDAAVLSKLGYRKASAGGAHA